MPITDEQLEPKKKQTPYTDYALAAHKAIRLNPDAPAEAAAVAVIETLLGNARQVVMFLEQALEVARTGQDGGNAVANDPNITVHAAK
jgi:hypothetical protein